MGSFKDALNIMVPVAENLRQLSSEARVIGTLKMISNILFTVVYRWNLVHSKFPVTWPFATVAVYLAVWFCRIAWQKNPKTLSPSTLAACLRLKHESIVFRTVLLCQCTISLLQKCRIKLWSVIIDCRGFPKSKIKDFFFTWGFSVNQGFQIEYSLTNKYWCTWVKY